MKLFAIVAVALSLGGCAQSESYDPDRPYRLATQNAVAMCQSITGYSAWKDCYDRHKPAPQPTTYFAPPTNHESSPGEQLAELLLLGAVSFGEGYTSNRSHRIVCTSIAGITTCD